MRRIDRAIDEPEALRILNDGEYGVLSTTGPDGQPYPVTVRRAPTQGLKDQHVEGALQKLE